MKLCGGIVNNAKYPKVNEGPGSYDAITNQVITTAAQKTNVTGLGGALGVMELALPAGVGANGGVLTDGDKVGRTFEQMCTIHPLMSEGRPLGVLYG